MQPLYVIPANPIPSEIHENETLWIYIMVHMNTSNDQKFGWTIVTLPSNPQPDNIATFYYIRRDKLGCTLFNTHSAALNKYTQLARDCSSCIRVGWILAKYTDDLYAIIENAFKPGGGRWVHIIMNLEAAGILTHAMGEELKSRLWDQSVVHVGVPMDDLDQTQAAWEILHLDKSTPKEAQGTEFPEMMCIDSPIH